MVKRVKDLYPKIYDQKNIELADEKARKCKRNRYGVRKHDEHREIDNYALYLALRRKIITRLNTLLTKYMNLKSV